MEYRSLRLAAGLMLSLAALTSPLQAAQPKTPPTTAQEADWEERLKQAKSLQQEGKEKRQAAQKRYDAEKKACFKQFRVTDCQEEARKEYIQTTNEARWLESEGNTRERDVRREQHADREKRWKDEAPRREADLKQREADKQTQTRAAEAKRAETLADKDKKAAANAEKRRIKDEKRRQKQEKHERKVAEKMQKAAPPAEAAK